MTRFWLLIVLLVVGCLGVAWARADDRAAQRARLIERFDADGDGAILLEEVRTLGGPEEAFELGDADKDDLLDEDELDDLEKRAKDDREIGRQLMFR